MTNVMDIKTAMPYDGADIHESQEQKDRHKEQIKTMNTEISRPELDAKLETIEARMDAHIQKIELSSQYIAESVKQMAADNNELKKEFRSGKWWAIGTAITAIFAIIGSQLALMQYNASWQQNYLTSLDNRIGYVNSKIDDLGKPHTVKPKSP